MALLKIARMGHPVLLDTSGLVDDPPAVGELRRPRPFDDVRERRNDRCRRCQRDPLMVELIGDERPASVLLADEIEKARCSLVVLVPYPARRWPTTLAERLKIVQWDRTTSIAEVRAAVAGTPGATSRE